MTRIVKRVPLDFDWPLNKKWYGYINPVPTIQCEACNGTSYNAATNQLAQQWYCHDEEPEWIAVETYNGQMSRYNNKSWRYHLTQDEVDALIKANRIDTRLRRFDFEKTLTADEVNEWAKRDPFGHDGLNQFICVKVRATRLGFYGLCKFCDDGLIWHSSEFAKLHCEFKKIEPPTGDGYQIWNEEYPKSPVFKDPEDLATWCVGNISIFGSIYAPIDAWMKIVNNETVPIDLLQ